MCFWTFPRLTLAKSLPRSKILVPPQQQKIVYSRDMLRLLIAQQGSSPTKPVSFMVLLLSSHTFISMFRLTWLHCKTPPVYGRFRFWHVLVQDRFFPKHCRFWAAAKCAFESAFFSTFSSFLGASFTYFGRGMTSKLLDEKVLKIAQCCLIKNS